jgi:uncharacterized protein (TIGR02246 family)
MDDKEGIDRTRREWIAATNAEDPERCVAVMDTDIVWFPPGMAAMQGRQAVHEWMAPFFGRFKYDFSVRDVRVRMAGEWAVERGTFTSNLTSRDDGKSGRHSGQYLILWHRETDERWYMERYIDITDMSGRDA